MGGGASLEFGELKIAGADVKAQATTARSSFGLVSAISRIHVTASKRLKKKRSMQWRSGPTGSVID